MQWNANGLTRHKDELLATLNEKNIDICLVCETHFNNQSYISLKNYDIYHSNHPSNNSRGGSAVIVKSNIEHWLENNISCEEFQATTVTVIVSSSPMSVTSVYSPPRHNIKSTLYKELINSHKYRFVMGGDFNAKNIQWGSRLTTPKGKELYTAIRNTGCEFISTGKPTYWPSDVTKIPDLIDFFIIKKIPLNNFMVDDGYEMSSDHSPIYLTYFGYPFVHQNDTCLINKRTDWNYFKSSMTESIKHKPIDSIEDIENEVLLFTQTLQNAAWHSTPELKISSEVRTYPNYIISLIKDKRKLRKKWQQTRSPQDRRNFNNATKNLSRKIKAFNDKNLQTQLSNLTYDSKSNYSLWKATKYHKRPTQHKSPLQKEDGSWVKNSLEKADLFAEHLSNIFTNQNNTTNFCTPDTQQIADDTQITDAMFTKITFKEVFEEIKQLKNKKSPGYDLITSELLKQLPYHAIARLTTIMNAALKLKYVPSYWKVAEIIMILKPGKDSHETKSYRPISLLPTLGKLFEKLFGKRLERIVQDLNIIPSHQFGFRKNHSTIEQIHRVTNTIEIALENKKVCSAVFLDISQAFDGVWHLGLIRKLKTLLPTHFCEILCSYLSDRYYRVRCESQFSDLRPITSGVPQGSILGPLLYLIYTYDMPINRNCFIGTFADDTVLMSTGKNSSESISKLQTSLNDVYQWTKTWGLKLNNSKSIHIDFANIRTNYTPLYIEQQQVPTANSVKYLGMILDSKLNWKEHIKKKREELNIKYRNLSWLMGRNSVLSIDNKLMIYNQILKPVWLYGIQLWGCAKNNTIDKIQVFQNKVIRCIVKAPWYIRNDDLHRDLKTKTVKQEIVNNAQKHKSRLQQHVNLSATQLLQTSGLTRRLNRYKPHDLLTRFN